MQKWGGLVRELKCFTDLVEESASPSPGTVFRGDTHACGNTEERAIAEVLGVPARADSHGRAWDHGTGEGTVKQRKGTYHDAIHVKLNTVVLFLVNLFGGLAPGAVTHLRDLSRRPVDRTEYELELYDKYVPDGTARHRSNDKYVQYWARRLSSAAVMADARRCLKRLPGLTNQARAARVARTLRVAPE